MSIELPASLATERSLREAAEAEVIRLRAQLEAIATDVAKAPAPSPVVAHDLAQVVSQLKQTQQLLEDQQDLVRQVIDNSPNLVYVEDADGRCILANRSYVRLLSQQAPPAQRPEAEPPTRAPQGGQALDTVTAFEECYHLEDGQTVWYYTTKSPLLRADGSRYLLTFSSDITDLKRAQRVAEESVQAKHFFMANMSHEIRTPLHGVMGLADLLKKGPLVGEQADYVEMIQSTTESLLVIINDILDFAKIESGKFSFETITFDILKTVQDVVRSFAVQADEKGLVLRLVGLKEYLPLAQGDPHRLRQVLVNLIGNAIKFTEQGAITVTIDASKRVGMNLPVTFSVADTGIGIDPNNLDQVFTSFRQADSSTARLYGGTGLGLTISKNLVELQGGQIGVHSEPGQGSIFYFTIPYLVSQDPLRKETTVIPQPDLLRGLSLLLAEDNAVNRLIAVSMLGQWHVKVDMAQNGEEALAKAACTKYDLILMDIQMPQLNGIEATARLRTQAGINQDTPIIALTADAIRVNANTYKGMGFTNFLTKPYTELSLYKIIAHVSQRTEAVSAPTAVEIPVKTLDLGLHYDFSMLGKLADDPGFIRKMLELFVTTVPSQVKTLQEAVEDANWTVVVQEAHRLKSTFGSLNIQPETEYLRRVEELAELQVPHSELQQLVGGVAKATQLFTALFLEELAQMPVSSVTNQVLMSEKASVNQ
ncbi:ATP-binding protein [Hymenobacter terrenus]|uniref:ATP-binding protein n=1 Tax=Hymenobacter terrenus TaxID=1629124 RepID=UPI0006986DD2|nr:ATP-binding protein [Hymenobacter terrenus]